MRCVYIQSKAAEILFYVVGQGPGRDAFELLAFSFVWLLAFGFQLSAFSFARLLNFQLANSIYLCHESMLKQQACMAMAFAI